MGGPIEGAEKGPRRHGRLGAAAALLGDERPHPALVAIALGDDAVAKPRRQRVDLEVGGRSLDLVEQAEHVRDGHIAQPIGERLPAMASRLGERLEQPIERSILAEEQDLVLAAEVVIEVAGREVGGDGDLPHPGGGEAAGAEHARRRPHDLDPARVGAD